jgi:hypothetical protein
MKMFRDIALVFGLLVIVLVGYYLNYAGFSYIDAVTDPETQKGSDVVDAGSIAKKQTESTRTAISSLNIKEQRAHYTTISDQLEKWVSAQMVEHVKILSHKMTSGASMSETLKMMDEINSMKAFKTTLDDCAKFVDSH